MAMYSGFPAEKYDTVFIILDKMDKIGIEGVRQELLEEGFHADQVDTYLSLFEQLEHSADGVKECQKILSSVLDAAVCEELSSIIEIVEKSKTADFRMVFDPTLVRGMSYYTGPIFEISMDEYGGSVGGGGRYDEMIGKFTGNAVSACGFSIGFERIVMLLLERGYEVPKTGEKKAWLIEKNMPLEKMAELMEQAQKAREEGAQINICVMKKNKKFQKDLLISQGYEKIEEFFA